MLKEVEVCNDLIYDIGLHKGEDTNFYLAKGFRVVAFEANPSLVEFNKSKFNNAINDNRLVIIEGAISDKSIEEIEFYINDNSVWGTISSSFAMRNERLGALNKKIKVPVVDFSYCIEKYGMPYYMKIDIEGADIVCLKSLLKFKTKPNYISIESNKTNWNDLLEEFKLFTALGFEEFQVINQRDISESIEPNPPNEGEYTAYCFRQGMSGLFGKDLPEKWLSLGRTLAKYKTIFLLYKLFGDEGLINKVPMGKLLKRVHFKFFHKDIIGWYDTHARKK